MASAVRAALAVDDSRVAQTADDLLEVGARQVFGLGDARGVKLERQKTGFHGVRLPCQRLFHRSQGLRGFFGADLHAANGGPAGRSGQGFVDTRIIWGLLSLDKKYSKAAIDQAAGIALEMQTLSSRLVERLIKLTQAPAVASPAPSTKLAPKFIRPMSVYRDHLGSAG